MAYENILSLVETFYEHVICNKTDDHNHIGEIWNKSEDVYRNYNIFSINSYIISQWSLKYLNNQLSVMLMSPYSVNIIFNVYHVLKIIVHAYVYSSFY